MNENSIDRNCVPFSLSLDLDPDRLVDHADWSPQYFELSVRVPASD